MCFIKTKESKLLIAKRDIIVYKIGIFEIPVGATVYINYAHREVVSTDIKYLGLLEE